MITKRNKGNSFIEYFHQIEDNAKNKNLLRYINYISAILLAKTLKYYYLNKLDEYNNNEKMYVGIYSVLAYIYNRLLYLNHEQLNYFLSKNDFITLNYLKSKQLEQRNFKVQYSKNMLEKYFVSDKDIMMEEEEESKLYYYVNCFSLLSLEFVGNFRYIMNTYFYTNPDKYFIPFIIIFHPKIFEYQHDNKDIKIYIIKLQNKYSLMILTWKYSETYPMDGIFDLLLNNNLYDVITKSKRVFEYETLILPYMNNLKSTLFNMESIIKETNEFRYIFHDIYDNEVNFDLFEFCSNAKLKFTTDQMPSFISASNLSEDEEYEERNTLILDSPFFYSFFDNDNILLSGGIYDYMESDE